KGIAPGILSRVTDPFVTTRTTRRTGLGLPLLKQHSEMAGGDLTIASEPGKGTRIIANFRRSHPDRQPMGDITGVMKILLASNPTIDFTLCHSTDDGSYCFSTKEVKRELDTDTISGYILINDIAEMINENLLIINASEIEYRDKSQECETK
nr:ATP-binding protein [Bacteroidales bacterium]